MNISVNYFSLLAAALASMILGFLWYSPLLFGTLWMKERKFTKDSLAAAQKQMGPLYGISFVMSFVSAYVLTHIMVLSMDVYHNAPMATGLATAFWSWLGFMLPVQTTATIFSDSKNWRLLGIDTGYQLVSLLLMGALLGFLQ